MEIYSKEWWREYRKKNLEKLRAYKREYDSKRYKTHRDAEIARRKRWALNNKEKIRTHNIVHAAVRSGKLIKKPCEECGDKKVYAHHSDYSKPLDVTWLCSVHHDHRHRH